ncbi:MAG: hypothetical protein JO325_03165 [Solirubrobacterales bacterium]|nr:hypothetical protein [Solirubrobacterales bacterium]
MLVALGLLARAVRECLEALCALTALGDGGGQSPALLLQGIIELCRQSITRQTI